MTAARLGLPRLAHPAATPLGPGQRLRIGYVSSDFGNHPLSHLMASVFGLHDRSRIEVNALCRFRGLGLDPRTLYRIASVSGLHSWAGSRCVSVVFPGRVPVSAVHDTCLRGEYIYPLHFAMCLGLKAASPTRFSTASECDTPHIPREGVLLRAESTGRQRVAAAHRGGDGALPGRQPAQRGRDCRPDLGAP